MKEITILEAEYKELKACHQMLGRIGSYVEDLLQDEETVEVGVLRLLADYYFFKSEETLTLLEKIQQKSDNNQC